jgi:hypothetical protein
VVRKPGECIPGDGIDIGIGILVSDIILKVGLSMEGSQILGFGFYITFILALKKQGSYEAVSAPKVSTA